MLCAVLVVVLEAKERHVVLGFDFSAGSEVICLDREESVKFGKDFVGKVYVGEFVGR